MSLVISLGEMFIRVRRIENYILFTLLLIFSMLMFQIGFIVDCTVLAHPWIFIMHLTFLFFVGPVGYFAYYLIILPGNKLVPGMLLYFLPVLFALAFDIHYILMPPEARKSLLDGLIYSGEVSQYPVIRLLFAAAGLQILAYLSLLFARFLHIWIREGRAAVLLVSMGYLVYTIAASELEITGYIFASPRLILWGCFMMALLFVCTFLTSQRFPRFLQLIIDETGKKYPSKPLLGGLDVDGLIRKLKDCMKEKKMHTNDSLSLKDLAGELGITAHQLSQLLNERLSTNFNNFVNQYRIGDAKEMLVNEPERSVISIAFAVGFNTKSSFYYAFSRFTGKTPQEFRKESL